MNPETKPNKISETEIEGLLVVEYPFYSDERGFLQEMFRKNEFEVAGCRFDTLHTAISYSRPKVLRGIHTEEWYKYVIPLTGKMFAAYVDTRPDSKTFGYVHTEVFDYTNIETRHRGVLLPPGVGNSIGVMGNEGVLYLYSNEDYWEKDKARGINLYDPDLNIDWPVADPVVSERDQHNPDLRDLYPHKFKNK